VIPPRRALGRAFLGIAGWAVLASLIGGVQPAIGAEYDPLERVNRPIFWFNDKLDLFLLEPVAKGWDFVFPDRIQHCIADVFENAKFPIHFTNDLLQAKPKAAGTMLGRFLLNSTLGVAGLFDVAAAAGLPGHDEDFGQTLGVWGLGNGPYLVIPVLGPSTFRDATGRVVDSPLRVWPFFVGMVPSIAISTTEAVNWRSRNIATIHDLRKDAFDYYSLVRNGYLQNRQAAVEDRRGSDGEQPAPTEENEEDLYFGDFEDES
jgi:phospholipid-binding lipoprotein MlaA